MTGIISFFLTRLLGFSVFVSCLASENNRLLATSSNSVNASSVEPTTAPSMPTYTPTLQPTVTPSSFTPTLEPSGTFSPSVVYTNIWNTSTATNAEWQAIACDSSGQLAIAATANGPIYLSNDSGFSWNPSVTTPVHNYIAVAASFSGQYLLAAMSTTMLIMSNNYGETWPAYKAISNVEWTSVAICGNSNYMYATASKTLGNEGVYKSSVYGVWTLAFNNNNSFTAVTCSATGQYVTVGTATNGLFTSSDYGSTWLQSSNNIPLNSAVTSVTMSHNGQNQIASSAQNIYLSSTYGLTWSPSTVVLSNVNCLTSDATGQYLAATVSQVGVYQSSNFGSTWTLYSIDLYSESWSAVTSSANGQFLLASMYNGTIYYYSHQTPYTSYDDVSGSESSTNKLSTATVAGLAVGISLGMGLIMAFVYYYSYYSMSISTAELPLMKTTNDV